MPRIIDHERKLELSKLDAYFPDHARLRDLRWQRESYKLDHTFPYLIAVGNLFGVISLFESYLLLLSGDLQAHTNVQLQNMDGRGITRIFKFFRSAGVALERVPLHEQILAAFKIRNCLSHSSGMLAWSRDTDEIRKIQQTGKYLSPEHRTMRLEQKRSFDEIQVEQTALGDRLVVNNQYCHLLCGYLRTYFSELCAAANTSVTPNQEKPT